MLQTSPEAETALLSVAQAVGARSVHITPVRICDHCQDPYTEAFPLGVADESGKVWADLCNDCYMQLTPYPHYICAGCGKPITGADIDSRVWEHEEGCLGPHHPDHEGCYCALEYHAACAPEHKSYEILNKDTVLLGDDLEGAEFRTVDHAADYILSHLPHVEQPFFISDETGDLVELVYAGARWRDDEALRQRIAAAARFANSTIAKLTANHRPYSLGAAELACAVLTDVLAALAGKEQP